MRRCRGAIVLGALTSAVAVCGCPSGAREPAKPAAGEPTPTTGPAVDRDAGAGPVQGPADAQDAARSPEGTEIGLRLAAYCSGPMGLHPLEGDELLISANMEVVRASRQGSLVREPRFLQGLDSPQSQETLPDTWSVSWAGGRWPDAVFMVVEYAYTGFAYGPQPYRLGESGWTRIANQQGPIVWRWTGFAPWTAGSGLTVREWMPVEPECCGEPVPPDAERALRQRRRRSFEVLGRAAGARPPSFATDDHIASFDALETGEAFALVIASREVDGPDGRGERSESKLMVWRPGQPAPSIFAPPTREGEVVDLGGPLLSGVRASGAGRAWAFGGSRELLPDGQIGRGLPYLARWDGTSWTRVDLPIEVIIDDLWESRDRRLWFAADGQLWRSGPGPDLATFEQVAVPDFPCRPSPVSSEPPPPFSSTEPEPTCGPFVVDVVAYTDEDVWVLVSDEQTASRFAMAVMHTGEHPRPLRLPHIYEHWLALSGRGPDRPDEPQRPQ